MKMNLRTATTTLAATLALGGAFWAGCGDDDRDPGALFYGDVSTVTASVTKTEESRYASWSFPLGPSLAWAQSLCAAPSGGNLLFCVNDVCTIVQPSDCTFSQVVEIIGGGPTVALLSFIDDANENAEADNGELVSLVPHGLVFCNEDRVRVANASVNFDTGATTAVVSKDFNACDPDATPNPTPTVDPDATPTIPNGGGTPTPTMTSGTPSMTPTTYAYSASLHEAPPTALAFLASIGVIGLLIPTRRRRD